MRGELMVCDTPEALAGVAAERFVEAAREARAARGRFLVALSGGSTPLELYALLASGAYRDRVPWAATHVLWSDERCVPAASPRSNFGAARSALLDHVAIPADQVHPVPTDLPPSEAARAYTRLLADLTGGAGVDLCLLGVGADGHVASLFPGSDALYVNRQGAVACSSPNQGEERVTFTMPEINRARHVLVLVAGAAKAPALADLRTGVSGLPAARVAPRGRLTWLVDRAAAGPTGVEALKRDAALAALEEVESGMSLGLGTGSTVRYVLEGLAAAVADGRLRDIVGVPTSEATAEAARALGLALTDLEDAPVLDVTLDGADEIDPALNLVKGGGGALLREKIVARASRRLVVVADDTKEVQRLGTRMPLPVEVVSFGWTTHLAAIRALGGEPVLRLGSEGPYVTDGGHYILDCAFAGGIADPAALEAALRARAGVVDTGLFLGMARRAYIASAAGVRTRAAPRP